MFAGRKADGHLLGSAMCELYKLAGWEGGLRDENVALLHVGEQ